MENLQKQIGQLNHFIEIISNDINSMNENLLSCLNLCNELKEIRPALNDDLKKFLEDEKEFIKCRKENLMQINKSNSANINESSKLNNYFGIIENKYNEYLEKWKAINEKVKPYCEKQNLVYKQSGKTLPSLLYNLQKINFINNKQQNYYEKVLLFEEDNINDIYSKAKKMQEVSRFKWEEFINDRIAKVTTQEYYELTTDIISHLIKDESLINVLLKKNSLWYDFYLIFFQNNEKEEKKRKLSDVLKNISDKKELLFFLNNNRANLKNLSKDFFVEVTNVMKDLQINFLSDQDYESSDLLFTVVQTYYYRKKLEKTYISDKVNNENSFKNENFLINKGLYKLRKERKKTLISSQNFMATNMSAILVSYLEMKWEKNFIKKIAEKILKEIKYDDLKFWMEFIDIYRK